MRLISTLIIILLFSCTERKPSREFYLPLLQKNYEAIESVTTSDYGKLRRVYADVGESMKSYFDLAQDLMQLETKLQKSIADISENKTSKKGLIEFEACVSAMNKHLDKIYVQTNYEYPEKLTFPKNVTAPIDSAEFWLMKTESKSVLRVGYIAIMTNISVTDYHSFLIPDVYIFAPGNNDLKTGDTYHAQLTLGAIDTLGIAKQELYSIKAWKNNERLSSNFIDSTTVKGSLKEVSIHVPETGKYTWEASYKLLRPSGKWDTIIKTESFYVE